MNYVKFQGVWWGCQLHCELLDSEVTSITELSLLCCKKVLLAKLWIFSQIISQFSQSLSFVWLCDPIDCSMPGFSVDHQLLELAQTHVHQAGDAIQPSHPLSPLLQSFPASGSFQMSQFFTSDGQSIGILASASVLQWLISFRMDWLDLLAVQGTLKSPMHHHSSKAQILQCSTFFIVQFSHPYMTTRKNIALPRQTFVGKVMSLLFDILSRLVIAFLQRSKQLLISRLHSSSAVILALKKMESATVTIVSPSICHEVMGPDVMPWF